MAMVPYGYDFSKNLKELAEEGEVKMSRIDDAVRRVLRLKLRLGLFETPNTVAEDYPQYGSPEFAKLSYEAALESEVLLKNNGILPLKRDAKILLTGPNANSMRTLNGGWSYNWQGHRASDEKLTGRYNTIYEALAEKFSDVTYVPGVEYDFNSWDWQRDDAVSIREAVSMARKAEVIIACIGENSYCETPGNVNDINLSENQKRLVRELAHTGRPVILILNEGRPRIINDIEGYASAVVDIMLPGNYGGDALAALLCGEENFSAKLPFTYPKYTNKKAVYDYKPSENTATMAGAYNYNAVMDVQWPFGYGLSYTSFEYSNMKVSQTEFDADDVLKVSIDVKNTGTREGREAVLLFSSDIYASCVPDVRRLRNFEKISLKPGECKTVEFELPDNDLAFFNHCGKWTLESGEFAVSCGNQSVLVNCTDTVVWDEANID